MAGLVAVSACSGEAITASVADSTPAANFARLALVPENANVCEDGVAKRRPDRSFMKWETRRKRVRNNESVDGKAVRRYHTIQFDSNGHQTRDVSCVLAVDEGTMPFMRSYFKQSMPLSSDQPTLAHSVLAIASSSSGGGQACLLVEDATWLCSFDSGDFSVCFANYAEGSMACYMFYGGGGASPPTAPPNTSPTGGHIEYTPPEGGRGGYYTYYPPDPNACSETEEDPDGNDECAFAPPPPPSLTPAEQISDLVASDPYALLDVPCSEIPKWLALATLPIPQSVLVRLASEPALSDWYTTAKIQTLQSGKGPIVNMDYYAVTVPIADIPNGLSVNGYLNHVRKNINDYVPPPTRFNYYPGLAGEEQRWQGSNPLGTVFSITLKPNVEEGSVVTTAYSGDHWIFSTVETSADRTHPVSGNRQFGAVDNGNGTATFYTRGTDRVSTLFNRLIDGAITNIFDNGHAVWVGLQNQLKAELGASAVVEPPVRHPVRYAQVDAVLLGQAPVSTLSCTQ